MKQIFDDTKTVKVAKFKLVLGVGILRDEMFFALYACFPLHCDRSNDLGTFATEMSKHLGYKTPKSLELPRLLLAAKPYRFGTYSGSMMSICYLFKLVKVKINYKKSN